MNGVRVVYRPPSPDEYRVLRREVGWAEVDPRAVVAGLTSSLFSVCLEGAGGEVLGCARVVGDRGIYLYVQDVIVRPSHQGRGLGDLLMDEVMTFIASTARTNTFVGLMAAEGVEDFYRRYGFEPRPDGRPGMYRMWGSDDLTGGGQRRPLSGSR